MWGPVWPPSCRGGLVWRARRASRDLPGPRPARPRGPRTSPACVRVEYGAPRAGSGRHPGPAGRPPPPPKPPPAKRRREPIERELRQLDPATLARLAGLVPARAAPPPAPAARAGPTSKTHRAPRAVGSLGRALSARSERLGRALAARGSLLRFEGSAERARLEGSLTGLAQGGCQLLQRARPSARGSQSPNICGSTRSSSVPSQNNTDSQF